MSNFIEAIKKYSFKEGMKVIEADGNIIEVKDIYYDGELNCEIIQCKNDNSYCNDCYCEIRPLIRG